MNKNSPNKTKTDIGIKMPKGYIYNCCYHLVWCTKYRQPIFNTNTEHLELMSIINRVASQNDIDILNHEVKANYVYLQITFPPKKSITNVVKLLKSSSARIWFAKYPQTKNKLWNGHLWDRSYYISTKDNVDKNTINTYINTIRTTKANSGRKLKTETNSKQ